MFRLAIIVLVSMLCFGCVSTSLKSLSLLKFEENAFEEKASQIVDVSEGSVAVAVNLYDLPQTVQINIPDEGNGELLGVRLLEKEKTRIDRHLLFNREYGVDDDGMVKIQLQAPFIYFLDGKIRYQLILLYYDRGLHKTTRKKIYVSLNWRPMKSRGDAEYSFDYYTLDQMRAGKGLSAPKITAEVEKANMERFAPRYQDKVMSNVQ